MSRGSNDSAERKNRKTISPQNRVRANYAHPAVPENIDPKMLAEHRRKVYDAQLKADILIHGRDGSMNATYDPYYHDPSFHFYNNNKKLAYLPYGVPPLTAPQYEQIPENHSLTKSPKTAKRSSKK